MGRFEGGQAAEIFRLGQLAGNMYPSLALGAPAERLRQDRETFTPMRKAGTLMFMFKEALQGIVNGTDGGLAGLIMDFEGIPLETYAKDESPFDMEAVGAEISVVVKAIQRAIEMLDAGETKEVAVKSDKMVTLIRVLDETYFLALAMAPTGNQGKGRYLLRIAAPKLVEERS